VVEVEFARLQLHGGICPPARRKAVRLRKKRAGEI
jgi:hypothetical protein